jgi:hypothetical protein
VYRSSGNSAVDAEAMAYARPLPWIRGTRDAVAEMGASGPRALTL